MALCRITVMLMLTTLTEGENQITDEVSLTLLGAPRESIELSQKKPQKVEMFLLGFFYPLPHSNFSLFLWFFIPLWLSCG